MRGAPTQARPNWTNNHKNFGCRKAFKRTEGAFWERQRTLGEDTRGMFVDTRALGETQGGLFGSLFSDIRGFFRHNLSLGHTFVFLFDLFPVLGPSGFPLHLLLLHFF